MKRAQDKIKDFIEPQAFEEVQNYGADPARALAAYHFTDATSDLIARWLDALADLPRHRGAARALAGLRGVGKSHALAAFGALVALPDLRSTVADAHVATSARRLLNRRYVVVRVERGTRPSLIDELRDAMVASFGGHESEWMQDPAAILAVAASRAVDVPLVVIIDTSFGRQMRVQRDDGPILSALAAATSEVNVFIALALDDDIEGADGANVALAGSFQIDYLDPEHLYRVADLHLFQKDAHGRAALHDLYTFLRKSVPAFNWSEPRFAAIYPVHPLVADVTPAVRLYAPTFAFLPFAATAAARATNRPALSLIGLDEVFDRAEYELRKAEDLKEAAAVYDGLATNAIAQVPIMQRLQAKLVLKGLFILSLDGRGATARELAAGLLLYDEKTPEAAVERVREMLQRFAEAAPADALGQIEDVGEIRYRFDIKASAGFDASLAAASKAVDDEATNDLLRVIPRARFEDWPFTDTGGGARGAEDAELLLMWRGMARRGRLVWQALEEGYAPLSMRTQSARDMDANDWEIVMLAPRLAADDLASADEAPTENGNGAWSPFAVWSPAALTAEEKEALHRLYVLRTNTALMLEFGETARVAERTHTALIERIWTRIYMDDGLLVTGDIRHRFTDEARAAQTLAETLGRMFSEMFAARYPEHPVFTEPLGETEVTRLVSGLFGGANQGSASVQELARLFAAPLGLVSQRGEVYALEAGDQILNRAWVRDVLALTDKADGEVVPLEEIHHKLRGEPYGLLGEAQRLILAALVAQRRIELVTDSGDRIGRRTLDLKLRWDEIAGIARAATLLHGAEELTEWARRLTYQPDLSSIAEPAARESVRAALAEWLEAWREKRLLENFDALSDAGLTTRTWKLAAGVRKSFGAAADAVEAALADIISLEEGLQRVADAFGDAPEQFARNTEQLAQLTNFIAGLSAREHVREYLAMAEPTTVDEIESARRELLTLIEETQSLFERESNRRFDILWREFHARYSEHYATMHAEVVGANSNRRALDTLTRGAEWREFEALAELSIINRQHWEQAVEVLTEARRSFCDLNVRQLLTERAACVCAFRLARAGSVAGLPQELQQLLEHGRHAYHHTLSLMSTPLAIALDAIARKEEDADVAARARTLSGAFARGTEHTYFTRADVQLIEQALQRMATPPPVRVELPVGEYGLLTRDELRARLNQWLDDLPDHPALVEVVGESDGDGAQG
ncbi:MAG: hypothetical protein JO360_15230 [Acidobacteria bacterium]|nr:hypothetical protein [Acidobacteriota bacterium]